MNDRIRELAEQVNLKLDDLPDEVFIPLEEFAELIVRECADALDKNIAPPSHSMNSLGWKLKQHFGVEE